MEEVFVYFLILNKSLSRFFQIHVHIYKTSTTKKHDKIRKNGNLKKWFLEMALIIAIPDTCEKTERGYCSSAHFGEKKLSGFQNSFWFA
jgi:uncharacterized protein (DUF927 family)